MLYYRSRRYSTTSTRQITTLDQLEAAFTAIVNNASRTRTISLSEGLLLTQLQLYLSTTQSFHYSVYVHQDSRKHRPPN